MVKIQQTWLPRLAQMRLFEIALRHFCVLGLRMVRCCEASGRVLRSVLIPIGLLWATTALLAQTSGVINYQGRVTIGPNLFNGTAQLKFALVNAGGTQIYWRNATVGANPPEPASAVSVTVTSGLYNVALGDTSLANMASIPTTVFASAVSETTSNPIFLRVWFNDGVNGSQRLVPDTRLTPVAFAMAASYAQTALTVPDGSISAAKLAPGTLPSGITAVSPTPDDPSLLGGGYQSFYTIPAPPWTSAITTTQPAARVRHQGVWTGREFFVWGGQSQGGAFLADGGLYDPVANVWTLILPNTEVAARQGHSLIWTGQRAIVWGGMTAATALNSGAEFDPATRFWPDTTSTTNAPAARANHAAVWTGSEMVIWGGKNIAGNFVNDVALYNPTSGTWNKPTTTGPSPEAVAGALGIWTGTEAVFIGGAGIAGKSVQSAFNPTTKVWRTLSVNAAPSARADHSVIWTGTRLLVWGGKGVSSSLADGASYDPVKDLWTPISVNNAPSARSGHSAIWTGREMLVLGGLTVTGQVASGFAYDPAADSWRVLSTAGSPSPRSGSVAVWTGTQALIFGGNTLNSVILAALQSLIPQPAWYFYRHP